MQNKPKIMWLNNVAMPDIALEFGLKAGFIGGWLVGLFKAIKARDDVELVVVFPLYNKQGTFYKQKDGVSYYGVGVSTSYTRYDINTENAFRAIIQKENPDLMHIFGTEFPHCLAMVNAFNKPEKTVINIQGLTSIYTLHYLEGVPLSVVQSKTFRERISGRGLLFERQEFSKRGMLETAALKKVNHVIGRTDWDKACSTQINPNVQYHHCYESLRDSFYQTMWDIKQVERHSLFVSQGVYALKGLHMALEALAILRHDFPDIKLYVGGSNILSNKRRGLRRLLSARTYPRFLERLITYNDLQDHVVFVGSLDEAAMQAQFLKTHVFISPSLIENSPNSVGEANLLGVPCVASHVGGVAELMEHYKEGYVYQSTAPYMLAYYIKKLFEDDDNAMAFSKASRAHAKEIYNRENNAKRMIEIYHDIIKDAKQ